jgi:hypothetical protein
MLMTMPLVVCRGIYYFPISIHDLCTALDIQCRTREEETQCKAWAKERKIKVDKTIIICDKDLRLALLRCKACSKRDAR